MPNDWEPAEASATPDLALLLDAIQLAVARHHGQTRDYLYEPYVVHVLRVARSAAHVELSGDAVIAAVLHDVVEDSETEEAELRERGFSARTCELVRLLTKPKEMPETDYYQRLAGDCDAACLKLLDRADNMTDLARSVTAPSSRQRDKLSETERLYGPLRERCANAKVASVFDAAKRKLADAVSAHELTRGDEIGGR